MEHEETSDEAPRTTPHPEDRQDPRQVRGRDPGAAKRKHRQSEDVEASRDVPPQEPPD
ncbi:hypothetical protein ACFZAU_21240 [Streptomyces sp. NPDC008238]